MYHLNVHFPHNLSNTNKATEKLLYNNLKYTRNQYLY